MATTTKSNAVFGTSIVLCVINVMNVISIFFADCACIIIAFANHALEFSIKCLRIWLGAPAPLKRIFTSRIRFIASKGTIFSFISFGMRLLTHKDSAAVDTNSCLSFLSGKVKTFLGAKSFRVSIKEIFSTIFTLAKWRAAFPKDSSKASAHCMFTPATLGAKTCYMLSCLNNLKDFTALKANLFNSVSWVVGLCFSAARTRTIMKFFGTIRICLNNLATIFASQFNSLAIGTSHFDCP